MSLEHKINTKLDQKLKRHGRIMRYIIAGTIALTGGYYAYEHPQEVKAAYETVVEYFK